MKNISQTMKKLLIIVVLLLIAANSYAYSDRKDYFQRPQVGLWFGPINPLLNYEDYNNKTGSILDTNIGVGLFFRFNTPYNPLKIGFESSYQNFSSKGVNELTLVPNYCNLVYLLPLSWPIKVQVKLGMGASWVWILPQDLNQWDPVFMAGLEISFPAGRIVNIGMRVDYLLV